MAKSHLQISCFTLRSVLFGFFFCCAVGFAVKAQNSSNLRTKKIVFTTDTLALDSLSLIPGSLILRSGNDYISRSLYAVDDVRSLLIWKGQTPKDTLIAKYRVFPLHFSAPFSNKSLSLLEPKQSKSSSPNFYSPALNSRGDLFGTSKLSKSGSISRGIAFGNSQDLSVNSNLNLQLSGQLSDNIGILASVTDENIPIQPEGNTQQLQDFDRVYIELFDNNKKLTVGDFQINKPPGYFASYLKRVRGGSFETQWEKTPSEVDSLQTIQYSLTTSASVSKGKFARNIIQGVEGNQGPYRLQGAENETFIIVLSGTERIFVDGILLKRGQENDYVIDYNTAEITFTTNRIITKDERIIAEFQYSDRNYARSLIQASQQVQSQKSRFYFNFYSEQDSKNQPLQQDLTDEDRQVLTNVGDALNEAIVSGVDSVAYSPDIVLYQLIDSLGYDSVFVFSNDSTQTLFRLSFSEVGSGNGDYIETDFVASGRVFQWVSPDTINGQVIRQGDFSPVILLATPKRRQMISIGGQTKFSENTSLFTELAMSNNDLNTFSAEGNQDNVGLAGKVSFEHNAPLGKKQENAAVLLLAADYETTNKDFEFIERIRPVEFERNWNVLNRIFTQNQHISSARVGWRKKHVGKINYSVNSFLVEKEYDGIKNDLLIDLVTPKYRAFFDGSLLQSSDQTMGTSTFLRHLSEWVKKFEWFSIGFKDEHEKNEFFQVGRDSLLSNSYQFYDWEVFLTQRDTAENRYRLYYGQRKDWAVDGQQLEASTLAEQFGGSLELLQFPANRLRVKSAYRKLTILDTTITNQQKENTLLGRVEHDLTLYSGAITLNTFYEIGSGLELKREFVYLLVPEGQGVYVWNDYNDNGIKELNEFEVAQFSYEANYIRVFTPSNDFVKTFTNQFSQSLLLRPASVWNNKNGLKKWLTKFSSQTAFRIDRKTSDESNKTAYNPFVGDLEDEELLSANASLRNSFFYNRTNPKYGLDYTFQNADGKILLTNGFESRGNRSDLYRARWNITREFALIAEHERGRRFSLSDFLNGRNFSITFVALRPTFSYQPNTAFKVSLTAEQTQKKNQEDLGGEEAQINDLGLELRYNVISKGSVLAQFNYIQIDYTGLENTSLGFEMLNGLRTGKNYTWSLSIQNNLSKNMQMNLTYNGRNSEEAPVIHAGGVQLRAFF